MRKIISGAIAVLLAAGGLALAAPAHAEDIVTDTVTTEPAPTEEAAPAPEPEPAPEVVAEPEPVVAPETAPAEPVVAEPVVAETAPVVQSKPDETGQPYFICDEPGYEAKVDTVGDPATVEVTAPEGFLIDSYCVKAGSGEDAKHIIAVDPPAAVVIIDHPVKDSVSHYQVHLIPVPDPEVTPLACVGVGDWYTEGDDLPPIQGDEGLIFQGGTGLAVGIRVPVTGNLQGWAPVSFVNTGGQSEFFFRIVVDLSADGGPSYKSLSFPGYSTIDSASVSYQFGESIAATAAAYPNNVITSVGFQTNSGASADYVAVLQSVTGPCATRDFSDPLPEDYSVPGEWTAGEFDCDDTSYVETRTVTLYTYSRDEQGNVVETITEGEPEERTVEREADCPVPTPTPTPEPTPDWGDKSTPVPVTLAATGGSDLSPILWTGGIALLLGLVALGAHGVSVARRR